MLAHVRVGQLGGPLPISQTMPWFFRQLSRRCSPAVPSCGSQAQSGEMWETHEDISYLPPMSAGCSPQGNACKLVPFLLCLLVNSYKYLDFRTCGYITFILPLRDPGCLGAPPITHWHSQVYGLISHCSHRGPCRGTVPPHEHALLCVREFTGPGGHPHPVTYGHIIQMEQFCVL